MSLINLIDFDSAQIFDEYGNEIELVKFDYDEERINLSVKFPMLINLGDSIGTTETVITANLRIPAAKLFLNDLKISAYDLLIEDYTYEIFSDSSVVEEQTYEFIESGQADDQIFDNRFRFEANVTQ